MIVQDRRNGANQNGRCGCFLGAGQQTHTVEYIRGVIYIRNSAGGLLETLYDLTGAGFEKFVPRQLDARLSGFDGRALIGCFGYDADEDNSRVIYLKGEKVYA